MSDPGQPRKPNRPQLKPSVWSPRPIPQPVEPLRTADPPTPMLRELEERERQRASLVAAATTQAAEHVGPKPHSAPPVPCVDTGLASPAVASEYKRGMQQLRQDWTALTVAQRVDRVSGLINGRLAVANVPAISVERAAQGGNTVGTFDYDNWSLQIGDNLFGKEGKDARPLTDDDANALRDTVYHEARHAEQFALIARRRAAMGESMAAIRRETSIAGRTVAAAVLDPLPRIPNGGSDVDAAFAAGPAGGGPSMFTGAGVGGKNGRWADARVAGCAASWDASYYGTYANERNAVLDDLQVTKPREVKQAADAYDVAVRSGKSKQETDAAGRAWRAASARYDTAYARYKALPEEADAWGTEAILH